MYEVCLMTGSIDRPLCVSELRPDGPRRVRAAAHQRASEGVQAQQPLQVRPDKGQGDDVEEKVIRDAGTVPENNLLFVLEIIRRSVHVRFIFFG